MSIRCEIVSQDRMVFTGDADIVVLPGTDGEMGILPHHAPLLTTLKYGIIRVRSQGQETIFTVAGGIAEIQPDVVTILADAAENVDEIDVYRAEAARKRAEESLAKGIPANTDNFLAIEAALRKSNLRLDAVRRYRHGSAKPPRNSDESR
jgi:F-type H+-transporting ATPase subunit epsilon